ncbi:MAG: hypothetical protein V3W18_14310 [candidate division Zixibacteria bacterium]
MGRCSKKQVTWDVHEVAEEPTSYILIKDPDSCPDPEKRDGPTIIKEIKSEAAKLARKESGKRQICYPAVTCQTLPEKTDTIPYVATIRTSQWGEKHTWTDKNGRKYVDQMCAYWGYENVKFNLKTITRRCAPRNNHMALIPALRELEIVINLEKLIDLSPHSVELVRDQIEKALLEAKPEDEPTETA